MKQQMEQQSLRRVIALALMRWHGQLKPEIMEVAGDLKRYTFMISPQVLKALEAMDNTVDWTTVWPSLLQLTAEQLRGLLSKPDLVAEDITVLGAARVIEGLGDG
jgi:hypothetical protein